MARAGIYITLGQSLGDGRYSTSASMDGADIESTKATLDAAIAVLVADGATPTQAHVTTANTALTALTTALARRADVTVSYNTATVTTLNQLTRALHLALRQAFGSGIV